MKSEYRIKIENQIKADPFNWKNYFELGKSLELLNKKQAFLCFENALFYAEKNIDKAVIMGKMETVVLAGGRVNKASIVILSYNLRADTEACINSIRETTPESAREIVVVDNNSQDDSVEYLRKQKDIILVENDFNAGFPGGCNIGIKAADENADILLLNNDVIMCDNSLFWLRMGLYEDEQFGSAGSVCNIWYNGQSVCDNDQTIEWYKDFAVKCNVPMDQPYEYKPYLLGYALLIRRQVLNEVGLLDEMFFPGNYEDNDYGFRIMEHGYINVMVRNSFLIHWCSKSFKKENTFSQVVSGNLIKFNKKYGAYTNYLMNPEKRTLNAFAQFEGVTPGCNVLEVKCGIGATLFTLKYRHPDVNFYGCDNDVRTARAAVKHEGCRIDTYNSLEVLPYEKNFFDIIFINCNHISRCELEEFMTVVKSYLKPDGKFYLIAENARHHSYWMPVMLRGEYNAPADLIDSKYLEKMLTEKNAYIYKWTFVTESIELLPEKEQEIINSLPNDVRGESLIRYFGLLVGLN